MPKKAKETARATTVNKEPVSGFSPKWTRLIGRVKGFATRFVIAIADHAARFPTYYLLGVPLLTVALVVIGYFTNFRIETDQGVLFTPVGSRPIDHNTWIVEESGFVQKPRSATILIHADGANILSQDGVARVFAAVTIALAVETCDEVCASQGKDDSPCSISGVTQFWSNSATSFNENVNSDEDAIQALSALSYPDGTPVFVPGVIGNAIRDDGGMLTFGASYMQNLRTPDTDTAEAWETGVIDILQTLQEKWDKEEGNVFVLEFFLESSFAAEFSRSLLIDIPLVVVAFVIMSIFAAVVFMRKNRVRSQSLLGFGSVVGILLSIVSGIGFCFCLGVPFTSMTPILPFINFGIGLDDVFIIYGEYVRTDDKEATRDRIRHTMEEVGFSIVLTTLTSTLAFSLGMVSTVPVVQWLCLYAFIIILINFLYAITWFVALVVVDENRMKKNRFDCCVCLTAKIDNTGSNEEAQNDSSITDCFMAKYADFLLKPVVKICVLVGFLALLGCLAWQTSLLEQYFDFTDLTPADSYIKTFIRSLNDYTDLNGAQPGVYFRFEDQSIDTIQTQMEAYVDDLVGLDEVTRSSSFFWLADFQTFVLDSDGLEDLSFNDQMDAFLADDVYGGLYENDIVRNESGEVTASRTFLWMDNYDTLDVKAQIDALANQRFVSEAQLINADKSDWSFFTFAENYFIWEFYSVSVSELIQSTWLGVLSVTLIGLFFIPHWSASIIVGVFISILYIDLLGVLNIAGVSVNTVSYITLVLSIGLMVDFIMHILLRYYEASGTRAEKVKETLISMGSSIFIGAVSTFLGTLPLAFSSSQIMSTVFVAFVGLVTLSAAHGLVLLPVVLSLIGTEECIREAKQEAGVEAEEEEAPPNKKQDSGPLSYSSGMDYEA